MRRMATDKLILCFILLMIIGIIVIVVCVLRILNSQLFSYLLQIQGSGKKESRIESSSSKITATCNFQQQQPLCGELSLCAVLIIKYTFLCRFKCPCHISFDYVPGRLLAICIKN